MKQFSSQFKKQSDSIRMRASEKRELKERLVSYMEYHPLPQEMRAEKNSFGKMPQGILSEPFFAVAFSKVQVRSFAGLFAVLAILVVPLVAERSLPGDILYPVKVQFNEELRSTLAFTPYSKVVWETERVERRIAEARLLAVEGKLTPEAQAEFSEAIKTHTDAAQREIALLRESNSDDAAIAEIAFTSALAVQSEVLEGHAQTEGVGEGETAILAVAEVVAQVRNSTEIAHSGAPASYEGLLAAVELESTRMYELFNSVKGEASAEEVADIERRLADAKRKISTAIALKEGTPTSEDLEVATVAALIGGTESDEEIGEENSLALSVNAKLSADESTSTLAVAFDTALDSADSADSSEVTTPIATEEDRVVEASELLKGTLVDIQKLINYLTNIDVRENVTIAELVPITPTAGERAHGIKTLFDETNIIYNSIALKEIDPKLRNKIRYGQEEVRRKLRFVSNAIGKGELGDAERVVTEAHIIALDMQKVLSIEPKAGDTLGENSAEPVSSDEEQPDEEEVTEPTSL